MNVLRQLLDLLERGRRQHAMTQIEDVTRTPSRTPQDGVRRREQTLDRSQQYRRIEIPLDPAVVTDPLPRFVERLPPVDANDVAARGRQIRKNRARTDAEVDERHPLAGKGFEDAFGMRQRELLVVNPRELARPRIEDLHRLHAGVDLRAQ